MLFMIIETFHSGKVKALYQKFEEEGRLFPEGVSYVNSWINEELTTCYQVMESPSIEKIEEWISNWDDFADFEIVPVVTSTEAKELVKRL